MQREQDCDIRSPPGQSTHHSKATTAFLRALMMVTTLTTMMATPFSISSCQRGWFFSANFLHVTSKSVQSPQTKNSSMGLNSASQHEDPAHFCSLSSTATLVSSNHFYSFITARDYKNFKIAHSPRLMMFLLMM